MLIVVLVAFIVSSIIATSFISENGFNLCSKEDNLGRITNCYYGLSRKSYQEQENYFCTYTKVKYCDACNQRVPLNINHYRKEALLFLEVTGKDTAKFNDFTNSNSQSKFLDSPETEKRHNVETWSMLETFQPYKLINARYNFKPISLKQPKYSKKALRKKPLQNQHPKM